MDCTSLRMLLIRFPPLILDKISQLLMLLHSTKQMRSLILNLILPLLMVIDLVRDQEDIHSIKSEAIIFLSRIKK